MDTYLPLEDRITGPPFECQRCGTVVDQAGIPIHDKWHERIDLMAVQLDEIELWMEVRA